MTPLSMLFSAASPGGARGRLTTLIFHRVLAHPDPLMPEEPDAARFDQICGWLAAWFNVLPLDEAVQRLHSASLPPRAAAITFDDGYADNHDVALPILLRHRLPATFFIATGFLDGGRMWNDTLIEAVRGCVAETLDLSDLDLPGINRLSLDGTAARRAAILALIGSCKYLEPAERQAVVDRVADRCGAPLSCGLMMRADQVLALRRAGMQIGAHTVTHPILARLEDNAARDEIVGSKSALEALLGERISLFAYPNGKPKADYSPATVGLVAGAGFNAAVSTEAAIAGSDTDRLQVPRFTPWDRARWRFGARLLLANMYKPDSCHSGELLG